MNAASLSLKTTLRNKYKIISENLTCKALYSIVLKTCQMKDPFTEKPVVAINASSLSVDFQVASYNFQILHLNRVHSELKFFSS